MWHSLIFIYLLLRQDVIRAQSTTYGCFKLPAMVLRPPECYDYRLSYHSQIYKLLFARAMFLLSNFKLYEVIIFWIIKIFELGFTDELKVSQNYTHAKYKIWETMLYIASFSTKLHGQSNDSLETRYVWLLWETSIVFTWLFRLPRALSIILTDRVTERRWL